MLNALWVLSIGLNNIIVVDNYNRANNEKKKVVYFQVLANINNTTYVYCNETFYKRTHKSSFARILILIK